MPADTKQPRAALPFDAETGKVFGAAAQNERDAGQRLDVVHDGRAAEEAGDRGEGRLQPRKAFAAFERGQQRGFFAANVCPGASVNHNIEIEARSLNVFSQPSL